MGVNKSSINEIQKRQPNLEFKKLIQATAISIYMILGATSANANIQQNLSSYEPIISENLYDTSISDDMKIIKTKPGVTSEIFDNLRKKGQLNQDAIKLINESEEVVVSLFSELIDSGYLGIEIPLNDHNINILKNIKYSLKILFVARDGISNYKDIFDDQDHRYKSLEISFERDMFKYKIINLKVINN